MLGRSMLRGSNGVLEELAAMAMACAGPVEVQNGAGFAMLANGLDALDAMQAVREMPGDETNKGGVATLIGVARGGWDKMAEPARGTDSLGISCTAGKLDLVALSGKRQR